jgi:hypothetical protein
MIEHVTVYRDPDRYAGWPANYGLWRWGDEIVVGFTAGYPNPAGGFHSRDTTRPFVTLQARSLDGGERWGVQPLPASIPGGRGLSADEHVGPGLKLAEVLAADETLLDCPGGLDFSHPDFALLLARTGLVAGTRSFFYTSMDRCRAWAGPYRLPMYGQTAIAARTDYLVSGPDSCTLFLTANKSDGREGRLFCARSVDGGRHFAFLAWIGPEPAGYNIMPASVRLAEGQLLVAVRCQAGEQNWLDLYRSEDDGATWRYLTRPVVDTGRGGNPPSLITLHDGRLCLTYGYRAAPFGLRAKLSEDQGHRWGHEIILRADGGNHDLGYPRTTQRPDGLVVTVYYFNDQPEGERYIAATLWSPS